MPATDVNQYFFEAKPLWVGKVGAAGVASAVATSIPAQSAVGLTNGNAYIVTVNRVNSAGTAKNPANERETFIGKLSGSNFIDCVRAVEGAAQAWEADTVMEILITATVWNKLIEGIEILESDLSLKTDQAVFESEHNADGSHNISNMISGGSVLDEDTFSSDSDEAIPTQQSTKSYVGNQTIITSSATPTPTGDRKRNELYISSLAVAAEIQAPSGTPANGNIVIIRIKDNETARALTYDPIYRAIGVILPTTTTISKTLYMAGQYNSADSKWDILAVREEA